MANQLKADVVILKVKQGINGKCIEIMVRWRQRDDFKLEVKIMVLGEYACGKSTLVTNFFDKNKKSWGHLFQAFWIMAKVRQECLYRIINMRFCLG